MSELKCHLERHLSNRAGKRRSIVKLTSRPCPYTSSFRIDELDVRLDDGTTMQLVLKDLSADAMLAAARRARPAFLYAPQREIQAYRSILPFGPAGTPGWYGAVTDPASCRYWLFLERVRGLELRHVGAFSKWERTARWIGRFHRAFPAARVDQLARQSTFLVYDARFYWRWLDRAQRFARRRLATRRMLDRIARNYGFVVSRLSNLPRTLIHGEFYPCNVLICSDRRAVRVCPVDWEMAGLGPGLIDLACLTAGWSVRKQRALARAYAGTALDADSEDSRLDLDCCRLHLAIKMLGWSANWAPPPQHAHDWLAEAAHISERIGLC
jgi:Phosphotransferase enzyme family